MQKLVTLFGRWLWKSSWSATNGWRTSIIKQVCMNTKPILKSPISMSKITQLFFLIFFRVSQNLPENYTFYLETNDCSPFAKQINWSLMIPMLDNEFQKKPCVLPVKCFFFLIIFLLHIERCNEFWRDFFSDIKKCNSERRIYFRSRLKSSCCCSFIGALMVMLNRWCSRGSCWWEWLAPLLKWRNKLIGAATDIKAKIAGGAPRKD